ncbi:sensor histidine kinase [Candidatus Saccharibacteria bacterium]|nr:sensor histidine kinase [Candidatus Saccharibacteria bacterium]
MQKESIDIPVTIHPRAFAAFGDELVTSDNVVLAELVKNAYDAFAFKVDISLVINGSEQSIEISDDGLGMSVETIKTVFATVATPYKEKNPVITRIINGKKKSRCVSGNKGVGRFSVAKIGKLVSIYTKTSEMKSSIFVSIDWDRLRNANSLDKCTIKLDDKPEEDPLIGKKSGTIIRIKELREFWSKDKFLSLKDELSRLLNPFHKINDFSIHLIQKYNGNSIEDDLEIELNPFINNPVYSILGTVDTNGNVSWKYMNNSVEKKREQEGFLSWDVSNYELIIRGGEFDSLISDNELDDYKCGPFSFEIRAWDLDSDSIRNVSETFNIKRSDIRRTISKFKGLSVYRDNILVLPKSKATKDWLGLDARRISEIGKRISTSQIIGMVNISSTDNPGLRDTTDRESLTDTFEYKQFTLTLRGIIDVLQNERNNDRIGSQEPRPLGQLIDIQASEKLVSDIEDAVKNNRSGSDIVGIVKSYHSDNKKKMEILTSRLTYYAQTASLGSVALVVMHEFLTGMNSVKRFLNKVKKYISSFDTRTNEYFEDAENGHKRLVELVGCFAPLCMKDLRKKKFQCDLYNSVKKAENLIKAKKISQNVEFDIDIPENISIAISEGELQTIFINLFDNACYWIQKSNNPDKKILVSLEKADSERVLVVVSDTGNGILPENAEKVFLPGVTSKVGGLGMGLVIVTEILSSCQCKIGLRIPSDTMGATFIFDLPVAKKDA